jgi:hypothetical protein
MHYQPKEHIMSNVIRETIQSALVEAGVSEYSQNNYSTYIDAVDKALTEKVYDISEALVEAGVRMGANRGQVETLVESVGLSLRPAPEPEPVVEAPSASDLEALYAENGEEAETEGKGKKKGKKAVMAMLQQIAEKQEAQDQRINALADIASRRLGVNV